MRWQVRDYLGTLLVLVMILAGVLSATQFESCCISTHEAQEGLDRLGAPGAKSHWVDP